MTERPNDTELPIRQTERYRLEQARDALIESGFYAYIMLDESQEWCVAADDEAGRVDVTLTPDGYAITLSGTRPGLFIEEESEWRRTALTRLAKSVIPNVSQGLLEENQSAAWSEEDQGVAVHERFTIDAAGVSKVGLLVRERLRNIDDLLTFVERQLRS